MNKKQTLALAMPLIMLVAIPGLLLFDFNIGGFTIQSSPLFSFIGSLISLAGIAIMAETINALHKIGEGTIAPWDPTINLVTSGLYGYVRNPMVGGATMVLLGESIAFESTAIMAYLFVFFIANSFYFQYIEEPSLEKRFGQKYQDYKKNVPMWVPRKDPWSGNGRTNNNQNK